MKQSIRALIYPDEGGYVVECADVNAVTQGDTLEEAIANMREVIALALEDTDPAEYGLAPNPSIVVTIEMGPLSDAG